MKNQAHTQRSSY